MRRLAWSMALAGTAAGVAFLVLYHLASPDPVADGAARRTSLDPAANASSGAAQPSVRRSATTAPGAEPIDGHARVAAAVASARSAYLKSVHASGLPSAVKAARRLEAFEEAADELAALGPGAIPDLIELLARERDPHASLLILTAISRVGGDAGAQGVLDALAAIDDPDIEHLFLDRLARSGEARERDAVEAVLFGTSDPENRKSLIASAVARGNETLCGHLPEVAAGDPEPLVRAQALSSLERLGLAPDALVLETIARSDPASAVKVEAIRILAASDPDGLAGVARDVLAGDGDIETVLAVLETLGRIEESWAEELLEEAKANAAVEELRGEAATAARLRELRAGRKEGGHSDSSQNEE